jgi:hypothetical protein
MQGQYNGNVMIVRLNTGYKEFTSVPGYEHQVGIAMPLRAPQPTGLPLPEEDKQLAEIEDALCASLEQQAESLFVAVITTRGMREFVFYTRHPEHVKHRFEKLRGTITSYAIQLMIQPDKPWRIYQQLT